MKRGRLRPCENYHFIIGSNLSLVNLVCNEQLTNFKVTNNCLLNQYTTNADPTNHFFLTVKNTQDVLLHVHVLLNVDALRVVCDIKSSKCDPKRIRPLISYCLLSLKYLSNRVGITSP